MLSALSLTLLLLVTAVTTAPTFRQNDDRQAKNLAFFDYVVRPGEEVDFAPNDDEEFSLSLSIENNELARTLPSRKQRPRPSAEYDSPIYYIRMPPQPYIFVPGLGYVSEPPSNPMSQFLNVPVSFVSNGKPNSIYQWTAAGQLDMPKPKPKPKPAKKPDSPLHRLPGQFTFNGRPDDIFILRDSYNSLYGDVLQNLYP